MHFPQLILWLSYICMFKENQETDCLTTRFKKELALKTHVILIWESVGDTPVEMLLPYSAPTINIAC